MATLSGSRPDQRRSWLETRHLAPPHPAGPRGHGPAGGHLRRNRPVQLRLHGLVPDRQLDEQLTGLYGARTTRPASVRQPVRKAGSADGPGKASGTLNARINGGRSCRFPRLGATRTSLPPMTTRSCWPSPRRQAGGPYAVQRRLPAGGRRDALRRRDRHRASPREKQRTLSSLVWTMMVVSLGGLVLIGLVGTV